MSTQPGILPDIPPHSRFYEFRLTGVASSAVVLLATLQIDEHCVIALGPSLAEQAGIRVNGLMTFPELRHKELTVPSTQQDLWLWVRGDSLASVAATSEQLLGLLQSEFEVVEAVDGFKYDTGRDLTGYEDGTENPVGDAAVQTAFSNESSFVAVQKWRHDMDHFDSLSREQQDDVFGRRRDSNEEYDAPPSAHVKRTAQEDFEPEAFLLRRSSPWRDEQGCGLMFVAFAGSFDSFSVQMRRMLGLDDDIVDKVFSISTPVTGGYYWCPPLNENRQLVLDSVS